MGRRVGKLMAILKRAFLVSLLGNCSFDGTNGREVDIKTISSN